jgi:hypothetical protein
MSFGCSVSLHLADAVDQPAGSIAALPRAHCERE